MGKIPEIIYIHSVQLFYGVLGVDTPNLKITKENVHSEQLFYGILGVDTPNLKITKENPAMFKRNDIHR